MALSQSTLANQLANLVPTTSEAEARVRLASAWRVYFGGATVNGAPAVPAAYEPAVVAFQAQLLGMSASGQAGTRLAAACSAFWATLAPLATAVWITAPVVLVPPITPPLGLATLLPAMNAVFAANLAARRTLAQAADALATVLHSSAGLGALVPGSVLPAPPAPLPVL